MPDGLPASSAPTDDAGRPEVSGHRLRTGRPDDAVRLAEICIRTGHRGEDARGVWRTPELIPAVWLEPYLTWPGAVAHVAADAADVPVGYVVGVTDTAAFEHWAADHWWPAVRERFPRRDDAGPDAAALRAIHDPRRTPDAVLAGHPAHLHVDLLPDGQGRGLGRALLERFFADVHARGARGVHLHVDPANTRATGFYRRLGLTALAPATDPGLLGTTFQAEPAARVERLRA